MDNTHGIVLLPSLFGTSLSFWWHWLLLKLAGYQVAVVDIYRGQKFKRPFFLKIVTKPPAERDLLVDELMARLNENVVLTGITAAVTRLKQGCGRVFIIGYGIGGTFGLKWAETQGDTLTGIVAYYPHLVYPMGFPANRVPPNFDKINGNCPIVIFFGKNDHVTQHSRMCAEELQRRHPTVSLSVLPRAGHAFADWAIQWCFPNPLYHRATALITWYSTLHFLHQQTQDTTATEEPATLAKHGS
ncbi:MAG TPA: hypothetical protein DDW36_03855 [Candidatus Magasanikbacteria bacterium]|nr:hypothetical protein [Candidatus Magasanikbacteria bacterium]